MKEVQDNCEIQNGVQILLYFLKKLCINCVQFIIYLILDFFIAFVYDFMSVVANFN